ncbi:MAG: HAD-IC family P-type ATPase [Syntrophobacterales bacterium]|nr:HAD-IC family P-type ATPase [Syntrophobacterales bacterium]
MEWYRLSPEEIYRNLQTSEKGLKEEEALKRLEKYGLNKLVDEEEISRLRIFLHQFTSPLIYILIIAGVITIALREFIDAGVIFAVITLNAIVGYLQEYKAEKSVKALKKLVVSRARVIRDGVEKEIKAEELVPGDVVILASGMRVPADIRLIQTVELKVDEAMLTGESFPVEKHAWELEEGNLTPGDQRNMAFMGTIVIGGRAKGVVVSTGSHTVLGSIARDIQEAATVKAPLQEKIDRFAKNIGFLVLGASTLLFVIGILIGENVKDMFMTAVAAAVAAIPEGFPIVITIAMAVGVSRMAKHNAIIRKLHAVETLGSTTVIGSDKTGTLTKNEMTVRKLYDGKHIYNVEGSGYTPIGNITMNGSPVSIPPGSALEWLLRIGLLCNESRLILENGNPTLEGDPTEVALIVSAIKGGFNPEREIQLSPSISIIPFESERAYMASLHYSQDGKRYIFVKGAPEQVLRMCRISFSGEPINDEKVLNIAEGFAKEGMRVLAFAFKEVHHDFKEFSCKDVEWCDETENLTFVGLQAMIDPPRPEAIEAISHCKSAGIRVIMITGDHAVTARAIAKELGIADEDSPVLTGRDLEAMDDRKLFKMVPSVSVYARVSPQHKLRIVQQLKEHGEIVAVTGDGVNDAPALKAAHIGVAMGKGGTDVAREAADMVLTDDNFASIFHAVREGRIVFDNIRKVTFFLIPTGVAAIISIAISVAMGIPIPYFPAQLLWINLVTNGLQDVALAFEPGERDILNRPPRKPGEGIMSRLLIERTILVGCVISMGIVITFMMSLSSGDSLTKARTIAMTTMVFFQFFQAWNSRSEYESIFAINPLSNPFLFYSMIAALAAQIAVIYAAPLRWVFRTEPLSFNEWLPILAISSTVIIVVEIDKWIRKRHRALKA